MIFCEAAAIYGVIVAIILQTKIEYVEPLASGFYPHGAYFSGFSILGAGITTGFANLVCGYAPPSLAVALSTASWVPLCTRSARVWRRLDLHITSQCA